MISCRSAQESLPILNHHYQVINSITQRHPVSEEHNAACLYILYCYTVGINSPVYQTLLSQISLDPNSNGTYVYNFVERLEASYI